MASETVDLTDFGSVVRGPSADATWVPAGFPTEDGGVWRYQEPEAVVVVQDGALRVGAVPFTRQHDETQILDNAKHMYFSARSFAPPEGGRLRVEWEMAAQIVRGRPGDLYDAFVSFHLMDLASGCATNFFVGNDRLATVYARLPFPGARPPEGPPPGGGPRYFAWFEEHEGRTAPGEMHRYSITWDAGEGSLTWTHDGETLKHETGVPELGPVHLAMGLMTEKDIQPGKGSVSCHGQGAVGTWRDVRVVLEER